MKQQQQQNQQQQNQQQQNQQYQQQELTQDQLSEVTGGNRKEDVQPPVIIDNGTGYIGQRGN